MRYTYDKQYIENEEVTVEECIDIIKNTHYHAPNGYSDYGNLRIMFIGKPGLNRPAIEISVEYFDEEPEYGIEETANIYHVKNPATKEWKKRANYVE
jgi:hypothetical protein